MSTSVRSLLRLGAAAFALALTTPRVADTQTPPHDSLRLGDLYREARARDPRARQLELLAGQTALRLRSLDAERLPSLSLSALAQYQSDVASIPVDLPGIDPRDVPNDTYDAHIAARQRLWDPSLGPRRDVERARLAESTARVRVSLFALRQSIDETFFAALAMQAQEAVVAAGIAGLEARLRVASERVSGGTALPSEAATLEAELLRRRQLLAELTANREAALDVLGQLTGQPVGSGDALVLPELRDEAARARTGIDAIRERPEYDRFARARELLEQQRDAIAARDKPRVSAFARAGHGRPGLDPLSADFDTYWLAGVQLEWMPWTWGTTAREREALVIEEQIVASEEAAFVESVRRSVVRELVDIDRLERALETDAGIVALRERILRETRLRFDEGVITSSEFVDRETELLSARLALAAHRVELERSRARLLTLLGVEVR